MDFSLTETQSMMRESLRRAFSHYDLAERRRSRESDGGFSARWWALFAEQGWLAIPFTEDAGGLGGSVIDSMVVMEEMGRALVIEPYLASTVLAGSLIAGGGTDATEADLLAPLIDGTRIAAAAIYEKDGRFNPAIVGASAERTADGWRLSGQKTAVLFGASADVLVVSARTSGERADRHGISLFLVDRATQGVSRRGAPSVDGAQVATVTLDGVIVPPGAQLGPLNHGLHLIEDAIDRATLAACAEAVGIMDLLLNTTLEYVRTREQFGRRIGSFQVVQHRLVDLFIELEQARSLLLMATARSAEQDERAPMAISALKAQVAKAGRMIGQQSIQLHGGIGMTDDLCVGWGFKRLIAIEALFGDRDYHLARFRSAAGY
jgi:alkylation response protein AidB-like acyl-CoA dehydrogenase